MSFFSRDTSSAFTDDLGRLILRITVGGLMLFHGIDKIQNGIGGIQGLLASKGLPGALGYGVYIGEIVAPLLILLGIYTRPAAAVLAFNMLVATLLAHSGDFLKLGEHGSWALELQAFYLLGAVAIALLGAGRFSVSGGQGKLE